MPLSERDLDDLTSRARRAGHDSIEEYCAVLVRALVWIADAQSGIWGVKAYEALTGRRRVDQASRAVAQRGHSLLDEQLADTLHHDEPRKLRNRPA